MHFGPKKCSVDLHIPWLENVSTSSETQIKTAVNHCFFAIEPCIVYTPRQFLLATNKDVLPTFHHRNVIYQFLCHCDSQYVGILPKSILQGHTPIDCRYPSCSSQSNKSLFKTSCSAIRQHLLQNPSCVHK